jgi:phosphoglycerate dehydrogenase-like enzyme
MLLLIPQDAEPYFEALPPEVRVLTLPREGDLPVGAEGGEFMVLPFGGVRRWGPLLPQMKGLKVIQTITAGVDWLLPLVPPNVTLCNGTGVHDTSVSEWVVAAILAMYKRLPELRDQQVQGQWQRSELEELEGSTVLILGYGSIARALELRLAPFGTRFLRVARTARPGVHDFSALSQLFPQAEVVVNLLPLTPQTTRILRREHFQQMKPGSLLVNAGRGQTQDQEALVELIRQGHLRYATDVTDPEPLPQDHPLWRLPGVLISPHCAGSTPGLYRRGYSWARKQVLRYVRGEALENVVANGY